VKRVKIMFYIAFIIHSDLIQWQAYRNLWQCSHNIPIAITE